MALTESGLFDVDSNNIFGALNTGQTIKTVCSSAQMQNIKEKNWKETQFNIF